MIIEVRYATTISGRGHRVVMDEVVAKNAYLHLEDLGNSWMLIVENDAGDRVHMDLPKSSRKAGDALVRDVDGAVECTLDGVTTKPRLT